MFGHALLLACLPALLNAACQSGWDDVDGNCVKFFSAPDNSKTFQRAKESCEANNALLAVPFSETNSANILRKAAESTIWVGLQRSSGKIFVDQFQNQPSYITWNSGEPNDAGGNEDCVELKGNYNNKYNDIPCSFELGYVCVKCPVGYDRVDNTCVESCSDGWTDYNGKCLKFFSDDNNLAKSEVLCEAQDATVFAPMSAEDNDKLQEMTPGRLVWLGFVDIDNEGTWITVGDAQSMLYTNWAIGEPNDVNNEDCALQRGNGQWNDLDCVSSNLPRVCAKIQNTFSLYH